MKLGWTPPDNISVMEDSDTSDPCFDLFWSPDDMNGENEDNTDYSSDSDTSISAPPFSPIRLDTEEMDQQDISITTNSNTLTVMDQLQVFTPNIEQIVTSNADNTSPANASQ